MPTRAPLSRPLAATLATVKPWLSPQVLGEGGWSRIAAVGAILPAQITNCFYLECQLGQSIARADLILGISDSGSRILAGENSAIELDPTLAVQPVWVHLGRLCRRWLCRSSSFHRQVKGIWIELDVATDSEQRDPLSAPRVFVDWVRTSTREGVSGALEALLRELGGLAGRRPSNDLVSALLGCVESLPATCSLYSVGFFPEPGREELRLCIRGAGEQLRRYLKRVGTPRDGQRFLEAEALVSAKTSSDRTRIVHLDVGVSRASMVGLEHSLRGQGRKDLALGPDLARLVASGGCTPAKRMGLCGWPGGRVDTLPHELWPSLVVRWVNHVKVTPASDGGWQAKAYLCHKHVPYLGQK